MVSLLVLLFPRVLLGGQELLHEAGEAWAAQGASGERHGLLRAVLSLAKLIDLCHVHVHNSVSWLIVSKPANVFHEHQVGLRRVLSRARRDVELAQIPILLQLRGAEVLPYWRLFIGAQNALFVVEVNAHIPIYVSDNDILGQKWCRIEIEHSISLSARFSTAQLLGVASSASPLRVQARLYSLPSWWRKVLAGVVLGQFAEFGRAVGLSYFVIKNGLLVDFAENVGLWFDLLL